MNRSAFRLLLTLVAGIGSVGMGCGEDTRAAEKRAEEAEAPPGGPDASAAPATDQAATVRVHYPAGGHTLQLIGVTAPFDKPTALTDVKNNTWELVLANLASPISFTPTLDGKLAKGPPYVAKPGEVVDVYPFFEKDNGKLVGWDYFFPSEILGATHPIRLYLPPSYDENTEKKYPVIYMHDGQVIFGEDLGTIDSLAKSEFGSWQAEKALDAAIATGRAPEAIVVGVDIRINVDATHFSDELMSARVRELTPTEDDATVAEALYPGFTGTGQGPNYLRMIAEELKPAIDQGFRTLPDREHTFLVGSSLGGLISVWGGLFNGDVFGAVASLSTAAYWDKEIVIKTAQTITLGPKSTSRIYVDTGVDERDDTPTLGALMPTQDQQQRLVAALTAAGYVEGKTLRSVVDPAGKHHGDSWSKRFPSVLPFLLGPGR